MLIGDKDFLLFWDNSRANLTRATARDLLKWLMTLALMPAELSGRVSETRYLLSRFSNDLEPNHIFWHQLAQVVQLAFPEQALSSADFLAHQVHQFRYVVSAYQAEWVRQRFPAQSDREALRAYLRTKRARHFWRRQCDFDLNESARLHNKRPRSASDKSPLPINIKILMGFHTEFILDSYGCFANEIDPEGITENGVINGASFNYANANDERHWELDVLPPKTHDPLFRKRLIANAGNRFVSPNRSKKRKHSDWEHSYFNKKGYYAQDKQSNYRLVRQEVQAFKKSLRRK